MIQMFDHRQNFLRLLAAVLIKKAAEHKVSGGKGLQIFIDEFRHQFIFQNPHPCNLAAEAALSGNQLQIIEALQIHQISYGQRHDIPPV